MIDLLMEIGGAMMSCNAEIHRIEETLSGLGYAYGAREMHVFAITSSIVVTMVLPDDTRLTQSKRIKGPSGFDFTMLSKLDSLCKHYTESPCSVAELKEQFRLLQESCREPAHVRAASKREHLGSMIAAGAFAMFFGGSLADGIAGAICGLLTCRFQNFTKKFTPNQLIFQLLNALLIGMVIHAVCVLLPFLQSDKIMIGVIMLLIPGIAMTNAVKDVFVGDTLSGLLRLAETVLWAGSLAIGFMFSMWLM